MYIRTFDVHRLAFLLQVKIQVICLLINLSPTGLTTYTIRCLQPCQSRPYHPTGYEPGAFSIRVLDFLFLYSYSYKEYIKVSLPTPSFTINIQALWPASLRLDPSEGIS